MTHCIPCHQASCKQLPRGPTVDTKDLPISGQFYWDFGLRRASSLDYSMTPGDTQVVTLFDSFNSYLLLVDATNCYIWVFPTASKEPPASIVENFLSKHGRNQESHFVQINQGGE